MIFILGAGMIHEAMVGAKGEEFSLDIRGGKQDCEATQSNIEEHRGRLQDAINISIVIR